jgi:hypothetical protein
MSKASRALDKAILRAFAHTNPRKPGAVIERMSAEDREALERLTEKDVQVRIK